MITERHSLVAAALPTGAGKTDTLLRPYDDATAVKALASGPPRPAHRP